MFNSIEKKPKIINQDEPIDTGEDSVENERANDPEQWTGEDKLHDQNEDIGGETVDLATGKAINNEEDMDDISPEMSTVSREPKNFDDLEDDNAKLLREKFKDDPEILRELGLD